MKLRQTILLPFMLCSFSLAACTSQKENSSSSFTNGDTSKSKDVSTIKNEFGENLYSLTITGRPELIVRGPFRPSTDIQHTEYSFPEGAWVIFATEKVQNAEVVATLNGEKLESYQQIDTGLYFQFSMPGQDSVLDISVK